MILITWFLTTHNLDKADVEILLVYSHFKYLCSPNKSDLFIPGDNVRHDCFYGAANIMFIYIFAELGNLLLQLAISR